MEPNLTDMDDYNKPLSTKKLQTISIAFVVTIVVYTIAVFFGKLF